MKYWMFSPEGHSSSQNIKVQSQFLGHRDTSHSVVQKKMLESQICFKIKTKNIIQTKNILWPQIQCNFQVISSDFHFSTTTSQIFTFLKEGSFAHQGCIYLIKKV